MGLPAPSKWGFSSSMWNDFFRESVTLLQEAVGHVRMSLVGHHECVLRSPLPPDEAPGL